MAKWYARKVAENKITIYDVPEKWRARVNEILNEER